MKVASSRREFLRRDCLGAAALGFAGAVAIPAIAQEKSANTSSAKPIGDEGVAPPEDLMREHGLLNRILLIYEELGRRIHDKQSFDPKLLGASAEMIHHFIEDYHEKLEEEHLFPRFRKANKLVDLVNTLQAQHAAGRILTQRLEQLAGGGLKNDADKNSAVDTIHGFIHMYRPHEAREDTVLFGEFRNIVSKHEFAALGEEFEKKEHQLFGEEGYEKNVAKVAEIEKQLGIYDLAKFTPRS